MILFPTEVKHSIVYKVKMELFQSKGRKFQSPVYLKLA